MIKDYDKEFYEKVISYLPLVESALIKITLNKVTYIYLEKKEYETLYTLRKNFYYQCEICDMSEDFNSYKMLYSKETTDPSLGALSTIFLQMIGFISDIQQTQDSLDTNERDYFVFSYGSPQDTNTRDMIPYGKNSFLTEKEKISILGIIQKSTDPNSKIAYDFHTAPLHLKLRELYRKGYYVFGGEFLFFPFIDDKGMIVNKNVLRNIKETPKKQKSKEEEVYEDEMEEKRIEETMNKEVGADKKISKYFYEGETTVSARAKAKKIKNVYTEAERINIRYAAARLDAFREKLGVEFKITSWFRSEKVNELVKGSDTSAHKQGLAIDFSSPKMSSVDIFLKIIYSGLEFDQVIYYPKDNFVHIGFRAKGNKERRQPLIKESKGYTFFNASKHFKNNENNPDSNK